MGRLAAIFIIIPLLSSSPVLRQSEAAFTSDEVTGITGADGVYSALNDAGEPCIRATLRAAMSVRYYTTGLINTRLLTREFELPDDVTPTGGCNGTSAFLTLTWDSGNSSLTFIASMTEGGDLWSVAPITMELMTGPGTNYPDITQDGRYTLTSQQNETFTSTPINGSYHCVNQMDIELHERNSSANNTRSIAGAIDVVKLGLYDVQIQAGFLPPSGFSKSGEPCAVDKEVADKSVRMVTMTIALCLTAVILFIVLGYGVIRSRSPAQAAQYATMD